MDECKYFDMPNAWKRIKTLKMCGIHRCVRWMFVQERFSKTSKVHDIPHYLWINVLLILLCLSEQSAEEIVKNFSIDNTNLRISFSHVCAFYASFACEFVWISQWRWMCAVHCVLAWTPLHSCVCVVLKHQPFWHLNITV